MDNQLVQTFKVIEECGHAADSLSKTISKFGDSASKLQKSVDRIEKLGEVFRENESLAKVLSVSQDVKKMMEQLHKSLPEFSAHLKNAHEEVVDTSSELESNLIEMKKIMPSLSHMADVTTEIHEISKMMKLLSDADFGSTIDKMQELHMNISKNILEQDGVIDALNARLTETNSNMARMSGAFNEYIMSIDSRLSHISETLQLVQGEWSEYTAERHSEQGAIKNRLEQIEISQERFRAEMIKQFDEMRQLINSDVAVVINQSYEKLHQGQVAFKEMLSSDIDGMLDMQKAYFIKTQEMFTNLETSMTSNFSDVKREKMDISKNSVSNLITHMDQQEKRMIELIDIRFQRQIKDFIQRKHSEYTEIILKEVTKAETVKAGHSKSFEEKELKINKDDVIGKVFNVSQLLQVKPPFTIQKVTMSDKSESAAKKAWTANYVCIIKGIEGNKLIGTDYKDGLEYRHREMVENEDNNLYQII